MTVKYVIVLFPRATIAWDFHLNKPWFEPEPLIKYRPDSVAVHIHKVPISKNWETFIIFASDIISIDFPRHECLPIISVETKINML